MNKIALLYGFLMGIAASLLGCFVFVMLFTEYTFVAGIQILYSQGSLGKLITLGTLLDLVLFTILLKMNKDLMARGVVLSVIVLTIATVFML